jgi:hypothetical protein
MSTATNSVPSSLCSSHGILHTKHRKRRINLICDPQGTSHLRNIPSCPRDERLLRRPPPFGRARGYRPLSPTEIVDFPALGNAVRGSFPGNLGGCGRLALCSARPTVSCVGRVTSSAGRFRSDAYRSPVSFASALEPIRNRRPHPMDRRSVLPQR